MEKSAGKTSAEKIREWAQFSLLMFTGVWGTWWGYRTFYYKEVYLPSLRPAALVISGSLEEIGRKGDMALVRARIHAINKKDIKIWAPALWFTLKGIQLNSKTESTEEFAQTPNDDQPLPDELAAYSDVEPHVIARWKLQGMETYYEPGDETTDEELFYIPLGRYEATQLKVEVVVSKTIDELASVKWEVAEDGSFTPTLMIKGPDYERDSNRIEQYQPNGKHREWQARNGVGYNWSVTTLSLLQVATEARKAKK